MPSEPLPIDFITVLHNSSTFVEGFMKNLEDAAAPFDARLIAVDSASTDDGLADLMGSARQMPVVPLRFDANLGYGAGGNRGLKEVRSPAFVVVINPDVSVGGETIEKLMKVLTHSPRMVAIAPALMSINGGRVSSGRAFPTRTQMLRRRPREMSRLDEIVSVDWLCGAFILFKPGILQAMNGFDEGYFLYYEDVDLGQRIRAAGGQMVVHGGAGAVHNAGHGRKATEYLRRVNRMSRRRYARRYMGVTGLLCALGADLVEVAHRQQRETRVGPRA